MTRYEMRISDWSSDVCSSDLRAGRADDPAALDLGDLADERADRARGGRHEHGLASFRLADIEQADIGGHARHAEHADPGSRPRQIGIDLLQAGAVGEGIFLPAAAEAGDPGALARRSNRRHSS